MRNMLAAIGKALLFFFYFASFGDIVNSLGTIRVQNEYDWKAAVGAAALAAVAYCSNSTILAGNYTHNQPPSTSQENIFPPNIDDFYPTSLIHNFDHDVNGFIGYSMKEESIYVVFRGTKSTVNWLNNMDTRRTKYPPCPGCEVHEGFYLTFQSVRVSVLKWTQELQYRFPTFSVILTGHSLGGALATLAAVDLAGSGVQNLKHLSFGSPRVFNAAAASFASSCVACVRTTHYRDIVPHNPFMTLGYTHITTEWYEDKEGVVTGCVGSESKHCADQWTFRENVADHYFYLGRAMTCSVGLLLDRRNNNSSTNSSSTNRSSSSSTNSSSSSSSGSNSNSSAPYFVPSSTPSYAPTALPAPPQADPLPDLTTPQPLPVTPDASTLETVPTPLTPSLLLTGHLMRILVWGAAIVLMAVVILAVIGMYRTLLTNRTLRSRWQYVVLH